jgi:putative NADH-flavin reductase
VRLAVFGGTGRVGRCLIQYATAAGDTVRALVRDPSSLPATAPGLEWTAGDVLDTSAVLATLEGSEVVLSALGGAGLANPGMTLSQGMSNIVRGMKQLGPRRVLAVAGSGVLDDGRGGIRGDAADFPAIYLAITREHRGTWNALRESQLDWTLVCCPDLVDGQLTGNFRTAVSRLPEGGSSISVEDVAEFMLRAARQRGYLGQRVGLAY